MNKILCIILLTSLAIKNIQTTGNVDPTNSFINYPFDGSYINDATPTITGDQEDSNENPVVGETVTIKIDGTALGTTSSDSSGIFYYTLTTGLSEGIHTVGAHCVQSSQNLTTKQFTVDTIP